MASRRTADTGRSGGRVDYDLQQQQQQRREPTAADHLRVALGAAQETEEMGTETLA